MTGAGAPQARASWARRSGARVGHVGMLTTSQCGRRVPCCRRHARRRLGVNSPRRSTPLATDAATTRALRVWPVRSTAPRRCSARGFFGRRPRAANSSILAASSSSLDHRAYRARSRRTIAPPQPDLSGDLNCLRRCVGEVGGAHAARALRGVGGVIVRASSGAMRGATVGVGAGVALGHASCSQSRRARDWTASIMRRRGLSDSFFPLSARAFAGARRAASAPRTRGEARARAGRAAARTLRRRARRRTSSTIATPASAAGSARAAPSSWAAYARRGCRTRTSRRLRGAGLEPSRLARE